MQFSENRVGEPEPVISPFRINKGNLLYVWSARDFYEKPKFLRGYRCRDFQVFRFFPMKIVKIGLFDVLSRFLGSQEGNQFLRIASKNFTPIGSGFGKFHISPRRISFIQRFVFAVDVTSIYVKLM